MAEKLKPKSHIQDISESWKRERPDLELTNFLFAIQVMRLGRVVDDVYDDMCRQRFGIGGSDMRVLFALRRAGKPYVRRATDLFRALLVTSGAITKQVDRLSKLGFVSRIEDPNLPMGVQLTPKGLRIANQATEILTNDSPVTAGVSGMSKAEFAAGRAFIQKVLRGLEAAHSSPARSSSSRRIKNGGPA